MFILAVVWIVGGVVVIVAVILALVRHIRCICFCSAFQFKNLSSSLLVHIFFQNFFLFVHSFIRSFASLLVRTFKTYPMPMRNAIFCHFGTGFAFLLLLLLSDFVFAVIIIQFNSKHYLWLVIKFIDFVVETVVQ